MRYLSFIVGFFTFSLSTNFVTAQEVEDFLACAEISDRVARVICLEEALDDATRQIQEQSSTSVENVAVETFGEESTTSATVSGNITEPEVEESTSRPSIFRLPRIRNPFSRDDSEEIETADTENSDGVSSQEGQDEQLAEFGRQARVIINEDGQDELNDIVADLEMIRPDQWMVTLASGQVWRQTHPRRLNLRKGDAVKIYPSGWGENYRLEAERLSGFIQVLRLE